MRTFETKIQELKTAVLTEVARLTWEDRLQTGTAILDIPEKIIPGPTATLRCCIYKERAIINSRVKLAMGGDKSNPCLVEVLPIACDECPVTEITVGPSCRGCLATRCVHACPKDAITIVNHRACTDHEKCIVAYHEIGHALVAAKQTHSAPVQKITIIPRTSGALGYTMQVDEGNHYLMNKEELENKIATLTGGRAAEEVVFHSITTGASNDIEQATKLARAMLTRYGMSDEFDMVALETVNNQYLGGDTSLACSAQTQCEIDQKVVELVKAQHAKAVQILTDNRAKLDELAQYLYQKETITGDEFMEILNREE